MINALIAGQSSREWALREIYKLNKDKVGSFILSNNGNASEAKDIFQESIIAFYENVLAGKFKGESKIGTYLYAIARFKWLNHLKQRSNELKSNEIMIDRNEIEKDAQVQLIAKEYRAQVMKVMSAVGEQCKELLIATIYHDQSMKEIVSQGKYSNEQIARNKKYKCLKHLREILQEQPELIKVLKGYV